VIKLALPAGDLRGPLAAVLGAAGLQVEGYGEGSRAYVLGVGGRSDVVARVFREKDIPIQVALGSYDLGVCSLAWIEELRARYPRQPLVPLRDLGVGAASLWVAAAGGSDLTLDTIGGRRGLRIASEYPNLAEAFALAARLPAYRIQPVWGAAEAYPPEDADLVAVTASDESAVSTHGLAPLHPLLDSSAWLVANAEALAGKGLAAVLGPLAGGAGSGATPRLRLPAPARASGRDGAPPPARDGLRMAIPDGHQQRHAAAALEAAGLLPDSGYDASGVARRPGSPLPGLELKVIRPHDMPQLVATGEFDLAITGRDCLTEHLSRFPSSPVEEVADLSRGHYNLAAVVSQDLPADDIQGALAHWRAAGRTVVRVASEFPGIADAYARSRQLGRYQVIPIAGASEGFVPADAELLIEGTETGRTLVENNLKPIDLLFRSTTCAVAGKGRDLAARRRLFDDVVAALRRSADAAQTV
jgi:ATP phosphoribosyltransferase